MPRTRKQRDDNLEQRRIAKQKWSTTEFKKLHAEKMRQTRKAERVAREIDEIRAAQMDIRI